MGWKWFKLVWSKMNLEVVWNGVKFDLNWMDTCQKLEKV